MIGIIILILAIVVMQKIQKEKQAKQTLMDFVTLINEKNYEAMYEKTNSHMSKEDFISRNKNIYEGIDSQNIQIEIQKVEKQGENYQLSYHQKMYTAAGEIEFDNQVIVGKQENEYRLNWSSNVIFPNLANNQKVRIATLKAKRGDILDRNGEKLATDGMILSCGIVPRKIRD